MLTGTRMWMDACMLTGGSENEFILKEQNKLTYSSHRYEDTQKIKTKERVIML